MKNNFIKKIVNLFSGKNKKNVPEKVKIEPIQVKKPENPIPNVAGKILHGNGEFHPSKHTIKSYATQQREAKKRKNIKKH